MAIHEPVKKQLWAACGVYQEAAASAFGGCQKFNSGSLQQPWKNSCEPPVAADKNSAVGAFGGRKKMAATRLRQLKQLLFGLFSKFRPRENVFFSYDILPLKIAASAMPSAPPKTAINEVPSETSKNSCTPDAFGTCKNSCKQGAFCTSKTSCTLPAGCLRHSKRALKSIGYPAITVRVRYIP